MKTLFAATIALLLAGCVNGSVSQTIVARPLFNDTTIGGPEYPIFIEGAENVGMTPIDIAQRLRFPARLRAGSSFKSVDRSYAPSNRAHLVIRSNGDRGNATLTFLHGNRRTGAGTFSLPRESFADPQALGSVSASLINDLLREAEGYYRDDKDSIWIVR